MILPGPASLAGQLNPGGYVLHLYELPGGRLVWADVVSAHDIVAKATEAADAADRSRSPGVVHVAYDGDTGKRLTLAEWLAVVWDSR